MKLLSYIVGFGMSIAVQGLHAGSTNTVVVNNGETLTAMDLMNGTFNGQLFDLSQNTLFHINTGGTIGPVGNTSQLNPFDFGGSSINLEPSAFFSPVLEITESFISNVSMTAGEAATIWNTNLVGSGAHLNLHGGYYAGQLYDGASLHMSGGILVSGTSARSGSSMVVTGGQLQSTDLYDASSLICSDAQITNGFGVFSGSTASLVNTDVGIESWVQSSSLSMMSGSVADGMFLQTAQTYMENVTVGNGLEVWNGNLTLVNTHVGDDMHIGVRGNVELISGSIGDNAYMFDPFSSFIDSGTLTIRGGSVGDNLRIQNGAVLNIHGGEIGNSLNVATGCELNLFVSSISINGVLLELSINQIEVITERDGAILEAILSDGSFFDLTLYNQGMIGQDRIDRGALLTVTRVPAPTSTALFALLGITSATRRKR